MQDYDNIEMVTTSETLAEAGGICKKLLKHITLSRKLTNATKMNRFNLIVTIIIFNLASKAQTIILFSDEKKYEEVLMKDKMKTFNPFLEHLKDSLPDATYILYNTDKKNVSDSSEFLFLKGTYKNQLRDGSFEYFNPRSYKGKTPIMVLNYKRGILNGSCYEDFSDGEKEIFFYQDGKSNGFCTLLDKNGFVKRNQLYKNDTLIYWTNYVNKRVYSSGFYDLKSNTKTLKFFDTNENISYSILLRNDSLVCVQEYYENGNIKKWTEGVFKNSLGDFVVPIEVLIGLPLITGIIKEFEENGKLLSEQKK